jgi:hypothetical protein
MGFGEFCLCEECCCDDTPGPPGPCNFVCQNTCVEPWTPELDTPLPCGFYTVPIYQNLFI